MILMKMIFKKHVQSSDNCNILYLSEISYENVVLWNVNDCFKWKFSLSYRTNYELEIKCALSNIHVHAFKTIFEILGMYKVNIDV